MLHFFSNVLIYKSVIRGVNERTKSLYSWCLSFIPISSAYSKTLKRLSVSSNGYLNPASVSVLYDFLIFLCTLACAASIRGIALLYRLVFKIPIIQVRQNSCNSG